MTETSCNDVEDLRAELPDKRDRWLAAMASDNLSRLAAGAALAAMLGSV